MTEDTRIILDRLDTMDIKMDKLGSEVNTVKSKMEVLETKMGTVESRIETLEFKMETVESNINTLESNVKEIKNITAGIQLDLENEVRKNIQIVAEGHLNLSRKLDAALKVEEEKEMLLIRTNILESDVRMLKSKADTLCSAG